ncbi:hypothetical protein BBOV_I004330 [Babesia bovis T2Bo]|nr:hypothetical protein BBOV_I004330 [Babesia bovis T2Bo]EDO05514.2 hypothetical protein BBOV_I004330 [Babesia bovis T2Bo]
MELVTSSSHRMKDLKYREERSDRLKAMVYSTKNVLLNLDPAFFRSIQKLGIWKNLEYTIWRTADGQLHMHCYCDGPGITRTVDYTLSNILSKEGAKLNIALRDNDFLGSGLQAEIMTQVGLRDWYKMSSNHTMSANMTYNTLKKTMWSDRSGDTMAFTLACNCGMDDVMRFVKPGDVNEAGGGSKSSVKGIMLFKAGATRGNVTVGLDTRTMQFSTDTQSEIRKSHKVPIAIKHTLLLKYPRKVPLNSSASDNLYLNSKASASTALGDYNIDIGLGMGTSTDKSGFRGNLAEGKRYLMIAGDVTRQWSQKHLWNTIKPGVFLDVLYSINGMNYPHGRHHFAVSAGVIVRVLGIAIAISLSEIPRNMGSGSADLLKSLQESFYVSS